jgi:predicted murein hydrolase (TIGR00659 family)
VSTLADTPLFALVLTAGAYLLFAQLQARFHSPLLNPVLGAIVTVAVALRLLHLPYPRYAEHTQPLTFLLGPAVVALGVTMDQQRAAIARNARSILLALGLGSVTGIVSAAGIARLLGASHEVVASLAPKSVTTPIAMAIAERLGGLPPLTAVVVILVGVLGAVVGPTFLRTLGVRSPTAWGLSMGAAAHAVGTARAVEEGEVQAATAALAIAVHGVITAVLAPVLMRWLG